MVTNGRMALAGTRVVELTIGGVGTGAAKILGDFGAEVIKVESPDRPDGMRGGIREKWEMATGFAEFNRNKKGVSLNLKLPENQELVRKLISLSDLFIDNYAPGVTTRLGLDYDTLVKYNPTLVMLSLSGLGQTGPLKNLLIWGPLLQAYTGTTALWNHPFIEGMVGSQSWHPDFFAGIFGGFLSIGALYQRAFIGKGCYIDAAESEIGAALMGAFYLDYLINKREPKPRGNTSPYMAPHNLYRCAGEERWVAIAVRDEKDWESFCQALGSPSWTKEERFSTMEGRLKHREDLDTFIEGWTKNHSPNEVVKVLQRVGVPAGEVMAPKDLLEDEHLNQRGFWPPMEGHPHLSKVRFEGQPINLSRTPWRYRLPAILLGGYNGEVLGELLGVTEYPG